MGISVFEAVPKNIGYFIITAISFGAMCASTMFVVSPHVRERGKFYESHRSIQGTRHVFFATMSSEEFIFCFFIHGIL